MDEALDKSSLLGILETAAKRPFRRLWVSTEPDASCKDALPHTHPYFRLIFAVSGSYRFLYWDKDKGFAEGSISQGDALATFPDGVLANPKTPPCRILSLILRDGFIRCLLSERDGEDSKQWWLHTSNPPSPSIRLLAEAFCALPQSPGRDVASSVLHSLLKACALEIRDDAPSKGGKAFRTYQLALAFMGENLSAPLSRAAVAKGTQVTPSHISKLFKNFAGKDFKEALKDMRVERALRFLAKQSLTVQETAWMCGFKSSAHFIRVFKAACGSSPGDYKSRLARAAKLTVQPPQ